MVDPVGPRGVGGIAGRLAPVAPVAPPRAPQAATTPVQTPVATSGLAALSAPAAATPPVDAERVSRIKKAIADGNFPLVPSTVADRLLALKLEWNPNDAA